MTSPARYFAPVSCDDLRAVFSKDAPDPNECGVERLGAFRGHLSLCAKCRATYGTRLEELVHQTFLPKIIRGLGASMSVETQQELLTRLQDSDLCIRMAAVEALGTLGVAMPVAVQEALVAKLADQNWTVRVGAVQALSQLEAKMPATVRQALEERVMDPDPDVKQAAEEALSRLDGGAMVAAFGQMVGQVAAYELVNLWEPAKLSVAKAVVQPPPSFVQQLVARTRDFLWSLCAPSPLPGFATLGEEPSRQSMALEEEEAKGTTTPSTMVLAEVRSDHAGPLLTGSGRFHLALHGPESRLVGKDLCCELQLIEGQTLSLRTPIRAASEGNGWEATFDEPVLTDPSLHAATDHQIPFDRHYLRLVVRPAQA